MLAAHAPPTAAYAATHAASVGPSGPDAPQLVKFQSANGYATSPGGGLGGGGLGGCGGLGGGGLGGGGLGGGGLGGGAVSVCVDA